ncbi:GNAT family N-acetyltransferase [Pseudochelatococcus contaminans]|uniref:Ribosomal-protein-alanine N-acetyltransferase n=1 Tax=Pseudochelatococcus contaminans TaxID=1538103 RepID=A0A7W5Z2U5_9HYPH|nr:GNAT family protein [Pseudochelatococcus contaminans]MBB3808815.1 ribosomal-protein-alanine N-acetyltransferase [Pseudochelatococcus contaminans]
MTWFQFSTAGSQSPFVRGAGIHLRIPQMRDFEAWAAIREESRSFLERWEPTWPPDDLTRPAFRRRIAWYEEDVARDASYPFFLFREEDGALMGGLTLGPVRRGVVQTCTLGYWMGERYACQGYMTKAVIAASHFVYSSLGLRRIEASCLPINRPSIGLLEKVGFVREGYAREYLCIAGVWEDHFLYAMLKDEFMRRYSP